MLNKSENKCLRTSSIGLPPKRSAMYIIYRRGVWFRCYMLYMKREVFFLFCICASHVILYYRLALDFMQITRRKTLAANKRMSVELKRAFGASDVLERAIAIYIIISYRISIVSCACISNIWGKWFTITKSTCCLRDQCQNLTLIPIRLFANRSPAIS